MGSAEKLDRRVNECSEGHSEEEKRTLTQLYAELDQENPDLEKIDQLLRAPAFNQLAVDHVCDDTSQLSALEHACLKGRVDLVQMLLDRGADVYGKQRNRKSRYFQPLHLACQSSAPTLEILGVVKLLVEKGSDIFDHDGNEDLPLMQAVDCNHAEVVEFLLQNGADPNDSGPKWYGTPPLVAACRCGDVDIHPRIVHLLLAAGANPNTSSLSNVECVKLACFELSVQKVLLLLAHKAQLRMALSDIKRLVLSALDKARNSDTLCRDNYFIILELLLAAGLKLPVVERKRLEEGLPSMKDERVSHVSIEVIAKTLELFDHSLSSPQKLKALCRIAVRSSLLPDIDVNIQSLPVPTVIQNYICFWDIVVRTLSFEVFA